MALYTYDQSVSQEEDPPMSKPSAPQIISLKDISEKKDDLTKCFSKADYIALFTDEYPEITPDTIPNILEMILTLKNDKNISKKMRREIIGEMLGYNELKDSSAVYRAIKFMYTFLKLKKILKSVTGKFS